jgi:hypothetical protein
MTFTNFAYYRYYVNKSSQGHFVYLPTNSQGYTKANLTNLTRQKIGKNLPFLTQSKAKLCENLIMTLIFEKNAIFSPKIGENRRKI